MGYSYLRMHDSARKETICNLFVVVVVVTVVVVVPHRKWRQCVLLDRERVELCTRYSGYSGRHLRHSAFSVTSWFNCHSRPFEWTGLKDGTGFWILLCWLEVALTCRLSK